MTDNAVVLDDFGKAMLERYVDKVEAYNKDVEATKSVDSIEDFKENFQENWEEVADINAQIEKLLNGLETLYNKRMAKVEPVLTEKYQEALAASGIDPEALTHELKDIKAAQRYLNQVYGDGVLEDTPKILGRRSSGGGGGGGTGGRRIRGFLIYVDGAKAGAENSKGVFKSTFSAAAKQLAVTTPELQEAFFKAAESEDVKGDDFPDVVTFDLEVEGETHSVRVVKGDESGSEE